MFLTNGGCWIVVDMDFFLTWVVFDMDLSQDAHVGGRGVYGGKNNTPDWYITHNS